MLPAQHLIIITVTVLIIETTQLGKAGFPVKTTINHLFTRERLCHDKTVPLNLSPTDDAVF